MFVDPSPNHLLAYFQIIHLCPHVNEECLFQSAPQNHLSKKHRTSWQPVHIKADCCSSVVCDRSSAGGSWSPGLVSAPWLLPPSRLCSSCSFPGWFHPIIAPDLIERRRPCTPCALGHGKGWLSRGQWDWPVPRAQLWPGWSVRPRAHRAEGWQFCILVLTRGVISLRFFRNESLLWF